MGIFLFMEISYSLAIPLGLSLGRIGLGVYNNLGLE